MEIFFLVVLNRIHCICLWFRDIVGVGMSTLNEEIQTACRCYDIYGFMTV